MLFRFFEFVLFQAVWKIIELVGGKTIISSLVYISGALLLTGYMFYRYIVIPNKTFAFPITGTLFSFFHVNNPDHFPALNENALKKHILLIIKNKDLPLNALIDKVHLYQGVDDVKYVLVVKLGINEQHPDFLKFMNHWQSDSLRFSAHKNFGAEVYRSGYSSASCLLDDWFICVQPLNEELPGEEILVEEHNWLLFKKQ